MVGAAIICQFVSMSVGQAIVGIFMEPVTNSLGWAVWQYTLGPSLSIGVGALAGLYAGPIIDQRGPRLLIIVGAFITAFCCYGLSQQTHLWQFLVLYMLGGLCGWTLYGPLVVNASLVKWFIHRRGWALAIGSMGISLGGLVTPLAMTSIVDTQGWQFGYSVLAIFVMVTVLPLAFVMRRTPEDYGLVPDGKPSMTTRSASQQETPSLTRAVAIRTRSFWLLVLGFGFNAAALMSVLVHAIPFATDASFTRQTAALALTVNGLGNLSSKLVWGYTLQHIKARRLVMTAYSMSAFGVAQMVYAAITGSTLFLFTGFFCYGFGFGGTIPLSEYLWASYFGRAHIGAIRGVGQPLTMIGAVFGPILVGLWYDYAQSYQLAFFTIIGVYLAGGLLILISREP